MIKWREIGWNGKKYDQNIWRWTNPDEGWFTIRTLFLSHNLYLLPISTSYHHIVVLSYLFADGWSTEMPSTDTTASNGILAVMIVMVASYTNITVCEKLTVENCSYVTCPLRRRHSLKLYYITVQPHYITLIYITIQYNSTSIHYIE